VRPAGRTSRARPATTGERISRLLFLVPYVAAREDGVPLAELAARLGIPSAELLAEIDLLCQVGPPSGDPSQFLLLTVDDGRVRVELPQTLVRPPRLSVAEAFALLLGAQAVAGSGIAHHEDALARSAAKIRRALGAGHAPALAHIEQQIRLGAQEPGAHEVVPELARAVRARRAVEIDYTSAGRGARQRRGVDPYGLVNHLGAWYLVGRCHIHDEPRIYKCERITRVAATGGHFTVPAEFDLARFQRDRLRLPTAPKGAVKLRFFGEAAAVAATWDGARKRKDGAVEVALTMPPNERLVGWVLGWGAEVQVLAPDTLAQAVAARLGAIAAAHT
jgi:proteasome accessory factor C